MKENGPIKRKIKGRIDQETCRRKFSKTDEVFRLKGLLTGKKNIFRYVFVTLQNINNKGKILRSFLCFFFKVTYKVMRIRLTSQ